jgi:peptidyl-prolyl cis-trans isomerase D
VFKLAKPADKVVSAGLYADEEGNQSVLVLEKVISAPETADAPLQQGLSEQLVKLKQEETYGALIEELRQKAKIKYAAVTPESAD